MTDPARAGATPGRPPGRSRRAVTLAAIVAVLVGAAGLAFFASLGPDSTTRPTPSPSASGTPYLGDLPLVTVPPTSAPAALTTPTATLTLVPTGSVQPSGSPSASAGQGIRAKRIRIDRLGIDLAIVEGDGVDAPIGKVAHYPGTAWPGGGSNIYIYGHARKGTFLALWKVKAGDRIELDLVDASSRTYVVTRVLPRVAFNAVKYLKPTKTEQLTLQTCTSYQQTAPRFIVIAVPAT